MKLSVWDILLKICMTILSIGTIAFAVFTIKNTDHMESLSRRLDDLNDNWIYTAEDGSTVIISLPAQLKTKRGEKVVIYRNLPEDFDDNCYLVLHEMKDLKVYVDGEERLNFSPDGVGLPGGVVKGLYMFLELKPGDEGKELKMVRDGNYHNGLLRDVYYGDAIGILELAYDRENLQYAFVSVLAIISALMAIVGVVILLVERKNNPIIPLAAGMFITSTWFVFDGELFQLIFGPLYVDGTIAFMLCMLIPYPFISYLNQMQRKRHNLIQRICQGISLLNFIVFTILHFTGVLSYINALSVIDTVIGFICLVEVLLIVRDIYRKKAAAYKWSLIGMAVMCTFSILELILINIDTHRTDGLWMVVGLYGLLMFGVVQTLIDSKRTKEELVQKSKEVAQMNLATVITIANAVDAKDKYTGGHSLMVAKCARDIGKQIGLDEMDLQRLYNAALLHDIGKVAIPDGVFNKPGKLSQAEYELIKEHPTYGADILKGAHLLDYVKDGVRYHHERWDGTGYPDGLKGEEIPLQARIICIADCYDAMNRNRIYRKSYTDEQVIDEYLTKAGKQFDPKLAKVFAEMIRNGYNINELDDETSIDSSNVEAWLLNKVMNEYSYDVSIKAETDKLTGLMNQMFMKTEVNKILAMEQAGTLLMIDMDRFRQINDNYGQIIGDKVIQIFSQALRSTFKQGDLLARMGGDEFAVFVRGEHNKMEVLDSVHNLCNEFVYDQELAAYADRLGLSVGIATAPNDGKIMDELYEAADRALYYVKKNGKGGICFFGEVADQLDDIMVPEEELNDRI